MPRKKVKVKQPVLKPEYQRAFNRIYDNESRNQRLVTDINRRVGDQGRQLQRIADRPRREPPPVLERRMPEYLTFPARVEEATRQQNDNARDNHAQAQDERREIHDIVTRTRSENAVCCEEQTRQAEKNTQDIQVNLKGEFNNSLTLVKNEVNQNISNVNVNVNNKNEITNNNILSFRRDFTTYLININANITNSFNLVRTEVRVVRAQLTVVTSEIKALIVNSSTQIIASLEANFTTLTAEIQSVTAVVATVQATLLGVSSSLSIIQVSIGGIVAAVTAELRLQTFTINRNVRNTVQRFESNIRTQINNLKNDIRLELNNISSEIKADISGDISDVISELKR